MSARTRAAAAAAVTLPGLLLAGCSNHQAAPAAEPVTMALCGGGPQVRPAEVEIVCGTNYIAAGDLAWSAWGRPVATAVGTAVVDLCAYEDCHTGSFTSVPIVVIASRRVPCGQDAQAYSRLQYVFVGTSPFAGMPANVTSSNFISAPGRPGLPADQTVTLACTRPAAHGGSGGPTQGG